MSVGILAHLLGTLPYKQLAEKVAAADFQYVQLALSKAISDVDCSLGKLSPGLANEIGGAFADQGVGIAVLGCYVSLIDLDDETYRHNIDRFKEHLRHARHFGAPTVALEVGKPVKGIDESLHWDRLNAALEEIVEEAERWGATIGLEAAQGHLIDTSKKLAATLERFPSSNLGIVLDPCNLLNATIFHQQDEIMKEAFELLGSRIVSAHAKDLKIVENGEYPVASAGLGDLNYLLFWELLEQHKPRGFVTLEGVPLHEMTATAAFVREGRAAARAKLQG